MNTDGWTKRRKREILVADPQGCERAEKGTSVIILDPKGIRSGALKRQNIVATETIREV